MGVNACVTLGEKMSYLLPIPYDPAGIVSTVPPRLHS
jgi:hypothetical protein